MMTVLEGEGTFNDATTLAIYRVAVAAVVTTRFSPGSVLLQQVLAVDVGTGPDAALGSVIKWILAALHDGPSEPP